MFLWAVLPLLQTLPCTCIMDIDLVTPESDLLQHLIIASDNLGDQHIYMCEMIFLFFGNCITLLSPSIRGPNDMISLCEVFANNFDITKKMCV